MNCGTLRKQPVLLPLVKARLAASGQLSLNSTYSSEQALSNGVKKAEVEKLCREDCSDTAQLWDDRSNMASPRFPDLRQKKYAHKALWLNSRWVEIKLTTKGPRTLEPTFYSERAPLDVGKKVEVEKLWRELFSDPTEWTDHRSDKPNTRFPDFKHKKHTKKVLWLKSKWTPPWIEDKLAALPPGTIQLSTYSWNQLLSRYVRSEQYEKTIELFQQMQGEGKADRFTFFPVLKACANLGLLQMGRRVHSMMPPGFEADICLGNTLIDMYAKCGRSDEAERVFNQMPTRDVVTMNAMIGGYVKCGKAQKALELFEQMQGQGLDPDCVTFVGVLNACANVCSLDVGRRAHEEIIHRGYESDIIVGNCLVDMYNKCGSLEDAERAFKQIPTKNVVTVNALIGGYVKCGEGLKALELFQQMQAQGIDPNRITFVGVITACASLAALDVGKRAHEEIIRRGYESNVVVGNCLIDMYAKCGCIEEAERVFEQMPTRNVVTLTAMINGYAKCGEGWKALELFEQMRGHGVDPNSVTFLGVINACASIAALDAGRRAHEEFIRRGYELNIIMGNCLVDMYAKCGSIEDSERVFNQMSTRDVVTWNALLAGYGINGYTRRALETFKEMCEVIEVSSVTFLSLLSACSHGGLVAEGLEHFNSMHLVYNITPTVEHFACVVDLLGRAGHLSEAEDLIMSMPMDPSTSVWMALLGACREHVNVEFGECCVKQVLELEPDNTSAYVLLANIYVAARMFNRVEDFMETVCIDV